ncbi:MAG: PepSY domain-containing protein, partial [Paracoccaceae bacterium]
MIFARSTWVLIHRYTGLFLLAFVFLIGFTGTFLAFYEELDHLALGDWHRVAPAGQMQPRDT